MVAMRGLTLAVASCSLQSAAAREGLRLSVNPIRKVVTMLQMMQNKIEAEGKKEQVLFDKFMCYCTNGRGQLEDSISAAETKIPKVESDIKEMGAEVVQLSADIEKAKADRADAKSAIAEATAIREKEAAAYAKESGDYKANLGAMDKAIAAIEKGAGGSFLQTATGATIRKLSITVEMSDVDRDVLSSFLSTSDTTEYAPQSGQITGILKQMRDTMQADLDKSTAEEEGAIKGFDALVAAKEKQINSLTKEIEDKMARLGNVGVKLSEMKEDLEDTKDSLAEDKQFLADLDKSCSTKQAEWDTRCKLRTEEMLAIADTIKILNDDDALELFKKTLPGSASLLQVKVTSKEMKQMALATLQHVKGSVGVDLISLALKGKKVSMEKVIKMVDDMVVLLGDEQKADEAKKEQCEKDIDETEDKHKQLNVEIKDLEKATEETKEAIATLGDEIVALTKGIKDLDKQVAEATVNRKEENEDYVVELAANNAAAEILGFAKNRLNKFYNPKMYKAAPKRELTEEERVTLNMGGTLAPTAAPGGIAGTGVSALQGAPPPPPETFGAYSKKSEESNGVIAMIDALVGDIEKEIQEMEFEEKDAQSEYEEFIEDSANKRATDSKSLTDKEAAKADSEANLIKYQDETKAKMTENMNTMESLRDFHLDCDWLLQNFDTRKEARTGEIDALKKAKAVLSGADFSLLQTAHVHRHI
jgi:septal ring factor EnvC (AmiA/AmiB activator)